MPTAGFPQTLCMPEGSKESHQDNCDSSSAAEIGNTVHAPAILVLVSEPEMEICRFVPPPLLM